MFIVVKISIAILLIVLHFLSCFRNDDNLKIKHIVIRAVGFIPILFFVYHLIKNGLSLFCEVEAIIEDVSNLYLGMFGLVYIVFVVRPLFNMLFAGGIKKVSELSDPQNEFFEKVPKVIFSIQRLFSFAVGSFIIIVVSIKAIPNDLVPKHESLNVESLLEIKETSKQVITVSEYIKEKIISYETTDSLTIEEQRFYLIDNAHNYILMNGFDDYVKSELYKNHDQFVVGLKEILAEPSLQNVVSADSIIASNSLITDQLFEEVDSAYQMNSSEIDSLLIEYVKSHKEGFK